MKNATNKKEFGSILSYTLGFGLSILLTLFAFLIAPELGSIAAGAIIAAALIQLMVQLIFFLHLGRGTGGEWDLGVSMLTVSILIILIGGTLWIMNNLAHLHAHAPTPAELYEHGVVAPENELK